MSKSKTRRNLSGIYFRSKISDGSWDNVCFEDLSSDQQIEVSKGKEAGWLISLAMALSNVINDLGDQFEIRKE